MPVAHAQCLWNEIVPLEWTTCVAYVPMAYFRTFGAEMVVLEVEVCLCRCLSAEDFHGGNIKK